MGALSLTSGTTQIIDNELSQRDCNDNNDHYHSLIITKVFAPFVWLSLENPGELLCRKKTVLISTLVESQQKWLRVWFQHYGWGSGVSPVSTISSDIILISIWSRDEMENIYICIEITQLSHSLHTPYAQEWLMDLKLKYFPL